MLSQSQLAYAWGPACTGTKATVSLHGTGKVTVRTQIIEATKAFNQCLVLFDYKTIYSQTGAYVCRQKVGGNGWSNHSYGTAIDINWLLNPYGGSHYHLPYAMAVAICRIRTNDGAQVWNWGGFWSTTRDFMHFEIVCRPSDLATGINWNTVMGAKPPTAPSLPQPVVKTGDKDMYYRINESGNIFHISGMFYRLLDGPTWNAEKLLNGASINMNVSAAQFMQYVASRKLKDSTKLVSNK